MAGPAITEKDPSVFVGILVLMGTATIIVALGAAVIFVASLLGSWLGWNTSSAPLIGSAIILIPGVLYGQSPRDDVWFFFGLLLLICGGGTFVFEWLGA